MAITFVAILQIDRVGYDSGVLVVRKPISLVVLDEDSVLRVGYRPWSLDTCCERTDGSLVDDLERLRGMVCDEMRVLWAEYAMSDDCVLSKLALRTKKILLKDIYLRRSSDEELVSVSVVNGLVNYRQ